MTHSLSRNAGGLYEGVRPLAKNLFTLSKHFTVLGVRDGYTDIDSPGWQPVPTYALPVFGPERFSFAPGFGPKLQEEDPDILHLHGLWRYPSVVAHRWHKRTGRPYVVHPHGMLDPWAVRNSHLKKIIAGALFENATLRDAACLRALCQSEADAIRQYGCRNPVCIVPNGIDLPKDDTLPSVNETQGPAGQLLHDIRTQGGKVLLYLGRLHPKKGLTNLLKAWAALNNSQPSGPRSTVHGPQSSTWTLAIAGWGELGHEQELKSLATELSIPWSQVSSPLTLVHGPQSQVPSPQSQVPSPLSTVHGPRSGSRSHLSTLNPQLLFLGPQFGKDKTACYRECDAFILPSYSEGLPMVILETWSHSKPVLMTAECNLPEGFSANAAIKITTEPDKIEQGLTALFKMPPSAVGEMGSHGRRLVMDKFSWKQIAEQLYSVCEWLVRGAPKPDCVYLD